MQTIKIVIIENSTEDIEYLEILFKTYFLEVEVVGVAGNVKNAYEVIVNNSPDIIFLDIELDNGSGFEVLEMLDGEGNFQIIACTSHKEYAVECYGHNVVDFLHKPFKVEDLLRSFNKAKKQLELINNYLHQSKEYLNNQFSKFIALTSLTEALVVKPHDIRYFKADGRYTNVVLKTGKNILVTKNLGLFEKLLDPSVFFRVHHSFVINLNEVVSIDRPKTSMCLLESGEKIPVSSRKSSGLLAHLNLKA